MSPIIKEKEVNGRFNLYTTENIYNFLLFDQLAGRTYQVQWNKELIYRFVRPIW